MKIVTLNVSLSYFVFEIDSRTIHTLTATTVHLQLVVVPVETSTNNYFLQPNEVIN